MIRTMEIVGRVRKDRVDIRTTESMKRHFPWFQWPEHIYAGRMNKYTGKKVELSIPQKED